MCRPRLLPSPGLGRQWPDRWEPAGGPLLPYPCPSLRTYTTGCLVVAGATMRVKLLAGLSIPYPVDAVKSSGPD